MSNVVQKGKHLLSPQKWFLAFVGLLVGGLVAYAANHWGEGESGSLAVWWVKWLDPWLTVATLVVAVLVWVGATTRAWEDELPKRLNIHFQYDGHYVLTCWEASLTGEGDIRAWAQQIGRQMSGRMLDFDPHPAIRSPRTEGGERGWRRIYEITIELTQDPSVSGYIVWGPQREDRGESAERPTEPKSVDELRVSSQKDSSVEVEVQR